MLALAGCDRFGDHPESFITPMAGSLNKIGFYETDMGGSRYLSVEGIWTVDGDDQIATPVNISTIICREYEQTCTDHRAYLMTLNGGTYLDQAQDYYEIRSWDAAQIIAFTEGDCRSIELRIDRSAKTVMTVTTNTPGAVGCSETTGLMAKPRISRLITQDELAEKIKAGDI